MELLISSSSSLTCTLVPLFKFQYGATNMSQLLDKEIEAIDLNSNMELLIFVLPASIFLTVSHLNSNMELLISTGKTTIFDGFLI